MVFLVLAGVALVLALVLGPHLWVQRELRLHAGDRPDLPGTGGELARHLLDLAKLADVKVERADPGEDHYDPEAKAVRLSPENHDGRSVTAVAIAAHEVSHALQDAQGHAPIRLRTRWIATLRTVDRIAYAILIAIPLVFLVVKAPIAIAVQLAAGIALLGTRVIVHLLTLPTEFDASFNRALPILEQGGYLGAADLPAARRVLRAAALTYVSAALMTLINVARWIRIFR